MTKPVQPISLTVKVGFLLLSVGLALWLFVGDWRYAVAGLIMLLVSAVVGAPTRTWNRS